MLTLRTIEATAPDDTRSEVHGVGRLLVPIWRNRLRFGGIWPEYHGSISHSYRPCKIKHRRQTVEHLAGTLHNLLQMSGQTMRPDIICEFQSCDYCSEVLKIHLDLIQLTPVEVPFNVCLNRVCNNRISRHSSLILNNKWAWYRLISLWSA